MCRYLEEFEAFIKVAPSNLLKRMYKRLGEVQRERFTGGKPARCELVRKGFTQEEFLLFMDVVDDGEDYKCFTFMGILGLRVGELMSLRGRNLQGDQLRIDGAKGGHSALIRLPPPLRLILPMNPEPDEKLFKRTRCGLYKRFERYRRIAKLTDTYLETKPCGSENKPQPRYRVNLHSFRHYAIKHFYAQCKDPDLTKKFARHKHQANTDIYLKDTRVDEVENVLNVLCQQQTIRARISLG